MKRFPFQCVASGKRGGVTLGMGGFHAARTGRTDAALPATRSVDAPLSRTGKCRAAGSGAPVGHIPERSSATAIARLLYCQACFLQSRRTAKSTCRIASSVVLLNLLYCQVCRKHGVPGFG